MNGRRFVSLALAVAWALALLTWAAPVARADDGAVGKSAQGAVPLQNDEVEMVAERVDIYPYQWWTFVEAEFTLRNTGPAASVLVGFPEEQFKYEEEVRGTRPLEIKDFTAAVDGTPVAVAFEPAEPSPLIQGRQLVGWHTFEVRFAAGQTRVLRHTYWLRPSYSSNGAQHLSYLLQTGATWKGDIGRADIYLHPSGGYTLDDLKPGGYGTPDPRVVRERLADGEALAWHLRDFEPGPEDDITVYVEAPGGRLITSAWNPREGQPLRPGDRGQYTVRSLYAPEPWPAGTRVALYAGRERVCLAEATLGEALAARPEDAGMVGHTGEFVLPAGLTPVHGRALEVWAEVEPGGRARSTLVFLDDVPATLPGAGAPPVVPAAAGLLGAALIALGTLARLRGRC